MVSFSSSVIKKGSKKFAPRAPSRRAPPSSHPSTGTQISSGTVSQHASQPAQASQASPASPAPTQVIQTSQSIASSAATVSLQETATASNTLSAHNNVNTTTTTVAEGEELSTSALDSATIATPNTPNNAALTPAAASVPSVKPIPAPTPIATPKPAAIPVPAPVPIPAPSTVPSAQPAAASSIATPIASSVQPSPSAATTTPTAAVASQPAPADEFPIERPAKRARISAPLQSSGEQIQTLTPAIPAPTAASETGIPRPQLTRRAAASGQSGSEKPATTTSRTTRTPAARARRATSANGEGRASTAPKTRRRRRAATPEDAASVEVEPGVVKMSELCKDTKTGRKSRREMELQKMDRQKREGNTEAASNNAESTTPKPPPPPPQSSSPSASAAAAADSTQSKKPQISSAPQMRVVNGEIVIDSDSLQIDRHADAARDMDELEEVVENDLTRRINYASFGKRTKAESWDEELTNFFYRGLRMFGTDFMMISKMFPGRNRRQIKLKFCNEERKNPARIRETLLGPRESITLEDYSEMTSTVYDDPAVVQKELDDERRRIEEEHAKEKQAREESLRNSGADQPLPSVEKGFRARLGARRNAARSASAGHGGSEEILGTID